MNLKLLFSPLLFITAPLFSQEREPMRFESISGLSQNTVYSILEDKQGFLWIATANGLNRYDGTEMKTYKPSLEKLPGNMTGRIVRSGLLEDDEENIWFSTDLSVNCFNKRTQLFSTQKLYWKKEGSAGQGIPSVEMFANPIAKRGGIVWFASAAEGLFALDVAKGICANYPVTFKDENAANILLMYNGVFNGRDKFWFATKNGLLCFDINTKKWLRFLNGQSFFTLCMSRDTLFMGSGNDFKWFDTRTNACGDVKKKEAPEFVQPAMIRRIIAGKENDLWAGDQNGNIYFKAHEANEFVWRGNINGNKAAETSYPVYCLYTTNEGHLWIGADVAGLMKADINPPVFKCFPDLNNIAEEKSLFIHSIYEMDEENIWLGTFQNGIRTLNTRTRESVKMRFPKNPVLPYAESVPLISKDTLGNIWTSYSGFVYIKEKEKKDFIPIKMPVPSNTIQSPQLWHVSEYKGGWLLSSNVGLYFVRKKDNRYEIEFKKQIGTTRIIRTWIAPDEKIWMVPETGGIIIFNNPDDFTNTTNLFRNVNVKALQYEPALNLLWISSSSGLIAYELTTGRYHSYTEKDGMQSDYVYGLIREKQEIWISTNSGLSRGVLSFEEGNNLPRISFTNFTINEGLPINEFNTGAFHKGKSGTFYFGSTKGVVWFKPDMIRQNQSVPQLQLISFLANEQPADSMLAPEYISSVRLPYNRNNLFLKFRAIDFNSGKKVRYQYQLVGWDKKWIYSDMLNEVRYNNLPPGQYTFRFRAAGSSGVWTSAAHTVNIIIQPPFWKTGWFYIIASVLLLITIIMVTKQIAQQKLKSKIRKLEKQKALDDERARISREMHDDIGAGLTQITLMSEAARFKARQQKDNSRQIDEIAETSRKLVSNMSEIIWSLGPENKTLEQVFAYLREQLNKQLEYTQIEYNISFPQHSTDRILHNHQGRNLLLVTKEIVNNAIKHSRASHISIEADIKQGSLWFQIKDNGVGFDVSKTYMGNGLKNIRKRISDMNGTIEIESVIGGGSSFRYHIPLKG
jgi:signal transduction histidine kinase/outer membrane lipoprotein-sorting protein